MSVVWVWVCTASGGGAVRRLDWSLNGLLVVVQVHADCVVEGQAVSAGLADCVVMPVGVCLDLGQVVCRVGGVMAWCGVVWCGCGCGCM